MFISIKINTLEKPIQYKITPRSNWKLHRSPIQFRRLNSKNIDQLGKVLEKIGHAIIKEEFPDMNIYDYYAFFHPLMNEIMLKDIDKYMKER